MHIALHGPIRGCHADDLQRGASSVLGRRRRRWDAVTMKPGEDPEGTGGMVGEPGADGHG